MRQADKSGIFGGHLSIVVRSNPRTSAVTRIVAVVCLCCWFLQPAVADESPVPFGTVIGDVMLPDYRGEEHRLSDFGDAKVVVVAVLGTECPLATLYAPRLQEIADGYADRNVVFLGVNANAQDSPSEIAAYARQYRLTFPILKDLHQKFVDALGATRTPSVVVLDAERAIRYRGRIDDQYGIGYVKEEPANRYLVSAIDALLSGQPVATASVEPIGCLIGRTRTPTEDSEFTYTGQVAALLNQHCVECHRDGKIAPFPLTDYESASGWAEMIAEVVREGRMPPWHAAEPISGSQSHDGAKLDYVEHVAYRNERRMSDRERQILIDWSAAGAPRGDGIPPAVPSDPIDGWQLPSEPDAVFAMREQPFSVPAEGTIEYQYFWVDPKFTEDTWIKAAEILPGNRAVVHHILVFAGKREHKQPLRAGHGEFLAAYVPGLKAVTYPPGMAKLIPAGSQLLFQVHYTPVGAPHMDLSKIGLVFADSDEIDHLVETRSVIEQGFALRPQESSQTVAADTTIFDHQVKLLSMMPHMHLRGQAFRYTLARNNQRLTLLDVPQYDFNWQTNYQFADPVELKRGDRILGLAWYDNSSANPANPDPTATVRWGDQTWNEMMIGYFDVAVPLSETQRESIRKGRFSADLRPPASSAGPAASRKDIELRIHATFRRYDRNGDRRLTIEEVPSQLRKIHQQMDRNNDGAVTPEEMRAALEQGGK